MMRYVSILKATLWKQPKRGSVYSLYILECADGTLYTGITTDVERRLAEHNSSQKGAKYTRSRRPVRVVYVEQYQTRSQASKREYQIKRRMTKEQKSQLIASYAASKR